MLLSVVLPFYNPMPYFTHMLESLLVAADRFLDLSLIEIICVNDGSSDKAMEYINQYKSYKNFHVVSVANGGVSNARNIGLTKCSGKYVWFVDADDYVPERAIGDIVRKIQSLTSCVDIIFANFFAFEDCDKVKKVMFNSNYNFDCFDSPDTSTDIFEIVFNQARVGFTLWNQIFKMEFLKRNKLAFNSVLRISEDFMFKVETLYCFPRIDYINVEIYGYRIPNGRQTLSQKLPKIAELDPLMKEQVKWFYIFDKQYKYESGRRYMKLLFSESLNYWIKYLSMYTSVEEGGYLEEKRCEMMDILEFLPEGVSALFHKGL